MVTLCRFVWCDRNFNLVRFFQFRGLLFNTFGVGVGVDPATGFTGGYSY